MARERIAEIGEMTLDIEVVANIITQFIVTQSRTGTTVPAFVRYRANGTELSRTRPTSGQNLTVSVNIAAPLTSVTHPAFGTVQVRQLPSFAFFERE